MEPLQSSNGCRAQVAPGAWWWILPSLLVIVATHLAIPQPDEPVFYGDENRHVMTGVFFRDALADQPVTHLKQYAESYYVQYPALGLLIWPPLFHFVEGALMSVFGTSYLVGQVTVAVFSFLACVYLNRLISRTHGRGVAAVVVLLFALTPLVFVYSHQVMLEMPTLAFCLAATFYFVRYLDESRRCDIYAAAIASACAALTRFDAVYLLPMFGILILARSQFSILWRREVLAAAAVALLMVIPFYAVAATQVGALHSRQASQSVVPETAAQTLLERLLYYPASIPHQTGLLFAVAAILGVIELRRWERRRENLPYVAMLLATWLTFTPIAEQDERHAIYWVPALALLAWSGVTSISRCRYRVVLRPVLIALLLGTTVSAAIKVPSPNISGYRAAAQWVLDQSPEPNRFLFDGWLDGNFTYHVRHLDPQRRHTVLRGDKLFYGFICVPSTDFAEYATNEQEMLDILYRFDPAFVVVEDPLGLDIPTAERLRDVLRDHPERFELATEIPVTGRCGTLSDYSLKIYRNLKRNPQPTDGVQFEVKGLNRSVSS
ncbi:phospholipid carrier-dependent glycosyltransferase [bacterium]|nr:phospholipid carrier-dependent glycosyltransferase [bacterium]